MSGVAAECHNEYRPAVSVIVAIYNAEATLPDCLDSLRQLDYPRCRLEVLCVDNGSTDGTPRLLETYRQQITILREERRGPAAARNAGLRQAAGEVIAFTDSDCAVDRNWLRALVGPLRDPRVGVVGGTILSKRPCNSIEAFGEQIHDHNRAVNEFRPPYAITMNWASRLEVFKTVGFFNEDLLRCSDADLSYRMVQAGYRLVYAPAAIIYHQNERTPWGLMREGYVHGYHAVNVVRLHRAFLEQVRHERREQRERVPDWSETPNRLPPRPWCDALWFRVFQLGKRIGRLHASWMTPP